MHLHVCTHVLADVCMYACLQMCMHVSEPENQGQIVLAPVNETKLVFTRLQIKKRKNNLFVSMSVTESVRDRDRD